MKAINEQKQELREMIRAKRRELDPAWVEEASDAIRVRVLELEPFQTAAVVACYVALPREVQTERLIAACHEHGKKILVPAFDLKTGRYGWSWLAPGEDTRPGHLGVPEPLAPRRAGGVEPDVLLVPAVAYDRSGGRLGHGGGHFDRLLAGARGTKVGLAFQWQILDEVPQQDPDVPVDLVVTEAGVYTISTGQVQGT